MSSIHCVRFPPVAATDAAAAAASLISPMLMTTTSRPHGRHSSESDIDTPPKADAAPFFEASPKGFVRLCLCFSISQSVSRSEK